VLPRDHSQSEIENRRVRSAAVMGMGYYWEGDDPLKELDESEREKVQSLALEAWARLGVPYVAIDIGQIEDGSWIVIETGDAQFSGVSTIPLLQLWARIARIGDR
jgi:ATP-grasp domain, R2K clade family 3